MCYEEIEGMTLFVCRDVYMLYKIDAIEKVGKLNGLWVKRIVDINVEVTGDDEVMGGLWRGWKEKMKIDWERWKKVESVEMEAVGGRY